MPERLLVWNSLVAGFAPFLTAPTFLLSVEMLGGWVLCPARHTGKERGQAPTCNY